MTNKLKAYNTRLQRLVSKTRGEVQAIRDDIMIPGEAKPQLIEKKRRERHEEIKTIRAVVDNEIEEAKGRLDRKMAANYLPESSNDPAAIAKNEQTWRRVKDLLDQGVSAESIA